MIIIDHIQSLLDCSRSKNIQYSSIDGLGGVGATGIGLGFLYGIHLTLFSLHMIDWIHFEFNQIVWIVYFMFLMFFHIMEFVITSLFQPSSLSKDCEFFFFSSSLFYHLMKFTSFDLFYIAFVVNHSKAYTISAMISWLEYWVSIWLGVHLESEMLFFLGIMVVGGGQFLR